LQSESLIIIGAGRFGAETLELAKQVATSNSTLEIIGFLDDNKRETEVSGFPVLGGIEAVTRLLETSPNIKAVVAIGDPKVKKELVNTYSKAGLTFTNLIHPYAIVPESVKMGLGCIITAGCILTVDITLGNHVILNLCTTVGHDAIIGDYTTINPQVAINGRDVVGEGVYIGSGATVIQDIQIGEWALIGAGAVVTNNIPAGVLAVGVPAKPIKESPYL